MHGIHGKVGSNLFVYAYFFAVFGPVVRLLAGGTDSSRFVAPAVVVAAALTVFAIRAHGGGGAGELLGLLAGLLSWAGWLMAWFLATEGTPPRVTDARKLFGASVLPCVLALALLLRGRLAGRGGGR
jgi:hypothetical protein